MVILRDRLPADVDVLVHWKTHGQWRLLDAPWEGVSVSLTETEEAQLRERLLEGISRPRPVPRSVAVIATLDGRPIGRVNRYGQDRSPETWMVGINICEDDCLDRGLGTEALTLWVNYLFANSAIERIGLDTWSFNPRMMHVAEKLGMVFEGAQRRVLQWEGQWLDLVHFGLLRDEWLAVPWSQ
jgi:RimJ/RimL family protein N-acetyltransferase